ncbi:MAG: Transcriptional activator MetR [Holophagaceae bacterium]|nr:Transcriptional activator MetR [Holophagaceae bacterium]
MSLEIRHLQLVQAILETGTMSAAAQRLNLSQPALSHQLRILEADLGAPLFHRLGRGLSPTAAGLHMGEAAARMLPEWSNLEGQLRAGNPAVGGLLRLATGCYTGYHWLPGWMRRLQEAWPGLEVRLVPEATQDPLRALREGRLDLALLDVRPDLPGLHVEPLFTDPVAVLLPRRHPSAGATHLEIRDLAAGKLLLPKALEPGHPLLKHPDLPRGALKTEVVPLTEALVALVRGGAGLALLPAWLAAPHLDDDLLARPLGRPALARRWWAALPRSLAQAPWWNHALQGLRALGPALQGLRALGPESQTPSRQG